jgi:hypothetical protein
MRLRGRPVAWRCPRWRWCGRSGFGLRRGYESRRDRCRTGLFEACPHGLPLDPTSLCPAVGTGRARAIRKVFLIEGTRSHQGMWIFHRTGVLARMNLKTQLIESGDRGPGTCAQEGWFLQCSSASTASDMRTQQESWMFGKNLVVRVVEIERCGPVVRPIGYGVADAPLNVSDAPSERHAWRRCVQRERFDGHGEGAYRAAVHSSFILITEPTSAPRPPRWKKMQSRQNVSQFPGGCRILFTW